MSALTHLQAPRVDWNVEAIREQFPILHRKIHGKPLIFLDSAASSQMPQVVIDRLVHYQTHEHANVHRGVHALSELATKEYEGARIKAQHFLGAKSEVEIIFVRGTTEGINLVAHSYGRSFIGSGDEIILSELEHHANIVPWQLLCEEKGATIRVVPMNEAGELDLEAYEAMFNPHTKFVALTHVSNALGTINPARELVEIAHRHGVPILLDGAQAVPHLKVDVQELDCDFYVFSGHKIYGPTGIGILYGKQAILEKMKPFQGGGDMIRTVSFERTTYNTLPHKFEAGTPAIAAAIGLGAAIDFLKGLGLDRVAAYEHELLEHATRRLAELPGVRILGTAKQKASVISFDVEGVHPHDVGTLLDAEGIAIRVGHHCAQPLMKRLGVPATARASFALYNTHAEIEALSEGIRHVQEVFGT